MHAQAAASRHAGPRQLAPIPRRGGGLGGTVPPRPVATEDNLTARGLPRVNSSAR